MNYSNEEIKEKIKDMEYDLRRDRYIGKDGSEFKVTPYSDGTGYKMDYYGKIYNIIYENVISICVRAIECGKYDFVYEPYKQCILDLEKSYIKNKQKTLSFA